MPTVPSPLHLLEQRDEEISLLHVVNLVRTGKASTKAEIGRLTGLGHSAVTQRIERLAGLGFIAERDHGASSGGRRSAALRFRVEQGHIIVCALGTLRITAGIMRLDGQVLAHSSKAWNIDRGPEETLNAAMALVRDLLPRTPKKPIWATVVSVPGPVDFLTGRLSAPPTLPGWDATDIREIVKQEIGSPAWIDSEANILALSARNSPSRSSANLIYFNFGSGLSVGLLLGDRVHRGANGAAGEIGHLPISDSHVECLCGRVGCLEAVAGGWALVREAGRAIGAGGTSSMIKHMLNRRLSVEDIAAAAQNGDPLALKLVTAAAGTVGNVLAELVNIFNPNYLIIGGILASSHAVVLSEIRRRVYERSAPLASRDLAISLASKHEDELLRGGAELALDQLFNVTFHRWYKHGIPR